MSARGTLEGAQVLDAFAGSGALGLETLSRGAAHVVFSASRGKEAARVVEGNITSLKLSRIVTHCVVVIRLPFTQIKGPTFDLVFLDPPYAFEAEKVLGLVRDLDDAGRIACGALIVYEYAKKRQSRC